MFYGIILRQILKNVIEGEHVSGGVLSKVPKLVDSAYGDGNGILDLDDVDDIASTVGDNAGSLIDFITSVF